jgi:ribose transport system substrate-binding protein
MVLQFLRSLARSGIRALSGSVPRAILVVVLTIAATMSAQGALGQTASPTVPPAPATPIPDPSAHDLIPVQAHAPYRLLLLVPFPQDPFWQAVQQAVTERAAADGVTVDVVALSAASVPEQLGQLERAITQGYSGILLGPVDAVGVAPGIAAANAAGLPVLAIDTAPVGGAVISVIRTDNVAATQLAGQFIGTELDGEGTVLNLQGDLNNPVAQERDQGLRKGLEAFPEISLVSTEGSWDQSRGYQATIIQLPQAGEGTPVPPLPLVDAVFAANPAMALGAAQAVEDVKADSVIVVGFGTTPETLDAIRHGILEAVIAELPQRAGVLAVDSMVRHLNGESVSRTLDSGFILVTGETLAGFLAADSR